MRQFLLVTVPLVVLMMPYFASTLSAQSASVGGRWEVARAGKPGTTILTITQAGERITGTWEFAKGVTSEIENCKLGGDTLTFSFVRENSRFNATAQIKGDTMTPDISQLTNGRERIHAKASRKTVQ